MEKNQIREIVKKSVEEVWYNRRSMNPVDDQAELLTEALHQALSASGVVGLLSLAYKALKEYNTPCCKSEWYRKGRANLRCKKCDADVTIELVLLHQALTEDVSNQTKS